MVEFKAKAEKKAEEIKEGIKEEAEEVKETAEEIKEEVKEEFLDDEPFDEADEKSVDETIEESSESETSEVKPISVNQATKGLSAARNAGFKVAKGNYIWWVDSDDTLEACFLPRLLERAEKERLDVLCSLLQLRSSQDRSLCYRSLAQ